MTIPTRPARPHGFALVVTLSLMILLTLLAVGLLTLSSIALRTSQQGEAQAIARANARLALMLALGDLQKFAGPDQRVTANAALLETTRSKVANRQWAGVWRTDGLRAEVAPRNTPILSRLTTTTGTDAGSLKDRREDGTTYNRTNEVLSWLVSNPSPTARLNPVTAAVNPVLLVGPGSAGSLAADQVSAPRVPLKPGSTIKGGYAWWVADENCKARFNLPSAPDGSTPIAASSPAWLNPAQEGIGIMTGLDQYESVSDDNLTKSLSHRNGELAYPARTGSATPLTPRFHDLSFHSAGVLADTQNGGLRRDLSAFLATGTLAASGSKPALTADTPILDTPMLQLVSAKFGMLKAWHDLAAKADATGDLDVVPPTAVANGIGGSDVRPGSAGMDLTRQTVAPIHPVILDAGISFGVSMFNTGVAGTAAGSLKYKLRLHYYPRFVLWNPYQAGIKSSAYAVQISMPDQFYVILNEPGLPGGSQKLPFFDDVSKSYLLSAANNLPHRPVFMVPAVQFKPGEALLFTADAGSNSDRSTPWGDSGSAAATSLANFRLSCGKPLPLQDSFMLESQYSIELPASALTDGTATYRIEASGSEASSAKKQYWYKLWQLKGATGSGSIASLLGNDTTRYPPLQYIDQSECGTLASYAPWFTGIPASAAERLRETKDARNAFYRCKWGHRFQWLADTNENLTIKPGTFNTPCLGYNLLANHNLRAAWHCWAPVENFFRASAAAGRYVHGVMIDDPYGWDWTNPQLAPVPVNGQNRVSPFGAPAQFGGQTFPLLSVPRKDVPLLSLGAFQHVPLSPFYWHPTFAFGNSLADPRGQRQRTTNYVDATQWQSVGVNAHSWQEFRQGQLNPRMDSQAFLYDLSYEANFALWDAYFLSTIPRGYTPGSALPNARIKPRTTTADATAGLLDGNRAAALLLLDGAFNVNSTSESAWAALLATFREDPELEITLADGGKVRANDMYARLIQPATTSEYKNHGAYEQATWNGYRKLSDTQIRALAKELVVEVKLRGPFLSLADFINRRLVIPPTGSGAETPLTLPGLKGTLQAAIDRSTINDTLLNAFKIDKTEYNMGGPANEWQVTYGSTYPTPYFPFTGGNQVLGPKPDHNHWAESKLVGAPGFLTQADVLQKLGSVLTARSDTFTIRSYGECRDDAGNITGRAWLEAVVQRTPQPLNLTTAATDASGLNPLTTGSGRFGRRFEIISFRWLNPSEI